MRVLASAGLALGLALATTTPASAVTTVLDFGGNICGSAGDQPCADGREIGQNYGDGAGVNVSYRSFETATGVTLEPFLRHWTGGYGDLVNVIYAGGSDSYSGEITFAALAGYEVSLLGFDAGCYLNRSVCQEFAYTVRAIGGASTSGTVTPPAGGHDSVLLNTAYSSSGYVLSWNEGFNGGLDNIAFDVRAVQVGAVPEPATWAMMIAGFGAIGGAMRRRRQARAFA